MTEATNIHDLDLPEIDIFSRQFADDPHAVLAEACKQHWLARYPQGFFVLDQQGIKDLNRADDDFHTPLKDIVKLFEADDTAWGKWTANHLVAKDHNSEDHQRIRRVVAPAFTPKEADKARDIMRDTINGLLDTVIDKGEIDFCKQIAAHYPISVMCRIAGFPVEDVPQMEEWVILQNEGYGMDPSVVPLLDEGVRQQQPYVRNIIEARMQPGDHPDDLIQTLVELAKDGEKMSVDELESLLMLLMGGAYDSTKQSLNLCIYMMIRHPEEAKKMAENPKYVRRFVEETLRIMGVPISHRVARHDVEYRDVIIPEGTFVTFAHLFSGRDPAFHEDPNIFNADRKNFSHTNFGQGAHICLGMFLAKAELEEALGVVVERMENIQLAGEPVFDSPLGFWGFDRRV